MKGRQAVGPYGATYHVFHHLSLSCHPVQDKGVNYTISSACATSAHCIGHALEPIQLGKQDIIFAGGGEELDWSSTIQFDAMGALSTKYNDNPEKASRTYDADRDGFVISGGGGILVVEELEHALARGAHIYAEITGYGATSDGYDMVAPSGEGAVRCMKMAMQGVGKVDYINTHGTSTPVGDTKELEAIQTLFGSNAQALRHQGDDRPCPGRRRRARGRHSLLMMEHGFIAPSINIENLDEKAVGLPIVREYEAADLNTVMSNSFGFGGTNASLVFSKFKAFDLPVGSTTRNRKRRRKAPFIELFIEFFY